MTTPLNADFVDLLAALCTEEVEFLIVGAHAVAFHAIPRATGDLDIFVRPSRDNAARLWRALARLGAPMQGVGVEAIDLAAPDIVYQIGLPPRRIAILTGISGVEFHEAWQSRVTTDLAGLTVHFIGREMLIKNKRACGRQKDLLDITALESDRDR